MASYDSKAGRGGGAKQETQKKASDYKPLSFGRITRLEAGTLYKAVKNGDVTAKPELTKLLYSEADVRPSHGGFWDERYANDRSFYDSVYRITDNILSGNMKDAQKEIDKLEYDMIKSAGKKSAWYKYKEV